ncbi:PH domain-containing protein [Kovacikia minuta CCNUW1]|uniref:PH domain-containing protein n=1 Tax=Kovacikia minuta TaxID=2931930 RepID=UPI001CCA3DE3|nr:PH domain-containing protein [Kovacikia minuta]UBF25493.1 PH domain-containing protein [Kovacikia minuta CCNUW1]
MGLISGLLGNASEVSSEKIDKLFNEVLIEHEQVEKAYQLIRDIFVFTNKRLILVDKQGITGKKVEFLSIPYSKITKFSKESAGHLDLDAELKIWVGSDPAPIVREFRKTVNINEVYAVLSKYVLN